MLNAAGTNIIGDIEWENSKHGSGGWATIAVPSRNLTGDIMGLFGRDTQGFSVKNLTVDPVSMTNIIRPDNTPAGTVGVGGTLPSVYGADWAGNSNTDFYAILDTKIMYYTGSTGLFTDTAAISGMATQPGVSEFRMVQQKGVSDPINGNVFYAFLANLGLRYTLTKGVSWITPGWIPTPITPYAGTSDPYYYNRRFGQIAVDDAGSKVNVGGATERFARIAASSSGNGIYLSTDGAVTGAKISPTSPHALDTTSALIWRGGTLYAVAANANDPGANTADNVWIWTTGGGWVQRTTNGNSIFGICVDPRDPAWFILTHTSINYTHVKDITTPSGWKDFVGGNVASYSMAQVKARARPFIARLFRKGAGGSAPGPMVAMGSYFYYLTGYGPLRAPISTFKTAGANFSNLTYSSAWNDWEEDTAGYEAVVGQFAMWTSKGLICGGQDIGVALWPEVAAGHDATYKDYPGPPLLTNAIHGSVGIDRNFAVVAMLKGGMNFGYCADGVTFTKMVNQPVNGNTSGFGPSGAVVAGPNVASGVAHFFPSYAGYPQYTDDLGATAWKSLRFFLDAGSGGAEMDLTTSSGGYHGFHGAPYYSNHWPAAADPYNPGVYYAVNTGSSIPAGPDANWEIDARGWGGLYKCVPASPNRYTRTIVGQIITWGNRGQYQMQLEFDGTGHLIVMPNALAGEGAGNWTVDIDLAAGTKRNITTVYNLQTMGFGPPLTPGGPRTMWAVGWSSGVYSFYVSLDRFLTAPLRSFNITMPGGGGLKHLAVHPTEFGRFGAALDAGHARGRFKAKG